MKAHKISGPCQRAGCEKRDTILFRIDGELFEADRERGVEAGYRLYCADCTTGITRAAESYMASGKLRR